MKDNILKIEKEFLEDHQAKLIVELDPEPLEKAKRKAAKSLSRKVKIPGFRPGKAPYNVVERAVGEGAILENALDILVGDIYPKVIEESGISPYGPGTLENMPTLDPPTFEFIVPLDAEVELGDYKIIRVPYMLPETSDKDVDRVFDDLRNRQAILEPVERPAEEGDQIFIRIEGKKLDVAEDESEDLIKERPLPIVIEPADLENKDEWPFPGFSRNLIGHAAGDKFSITHTFTDDSEFETLRGTKVEFSISIEDIKSRQIPELDDEFAQSLGDYEDIEELQETIRRDLEQQTKSEYDSGYNQEIIEKIIESSSIKYPPQMLEDEIEVYIDQLKNRLTQQGLDLDIYLKSRQMDIEELKEEILPQAENRLKRSLILFEVSRAEDIQIDEAEVQAQTQETLDELNRSLTPEQARKTLTQDFMRSWVGNITADMIIQKTVDHLRDIAQDKIVDVSDDSGSIDAEADTGETEQQMEEEAAEIEEDDIDAATDQEETEK